MRDWVLNNFWWKVTALLLAVGAWFGLTPGGEVPFSLPPPGIGYSTRELVAHPIIVTKDAADTREFKVTPSVVDITISSRNLETLREVDGREIRPTIDLRDFDTNQTTVQIAVFIPEKERRGLELVKLVPERVRVELVR